MKSPSASRVLVIAPEPHPINVCKPVTDCSRKTWTCTWITGSHSHSYVSITPFPRHAPCYSASLSLILDCDADDRRQGLESSSLDGKPQSPSSLSPAL